MLMKNKIENQSMLKNIFDAQKKKRTIIIVSMIVAALIIILTCIIINSTNSNQNETNVDPTEVKSDQYFLTQDDANKILQDGQTILKQNPNDTNAAVNYYGEQIKEKMEKGDKIAAFQVLWIGYDDLSNRELNAEAIKLLEKVDVDQFNNGYKASIYKAFANSYSRLDNSEMAEKYTNLANEAQKQYDAENATNEP